MANSIYISTVYFLLLFCSCSDKQSANEHFSSGSASEVIEQVEFQPFAKHVNRLIRKLEYLGSPLPEETVKKLHTLTADTVNKNVVEIQKVLDSFCLANVMINPESRVKSTQGPAPARLYYQHPQRFLVKIINEAGVTSRLRLTSDESLESKQQLDHTHSQMDGENQDLFNFRVYMPGGSWLHSPAKQNLTGLEVNYGVVFVTCNQSGKREATLSFDVGQGTQDIGFRSDLPILFNSLPIKDLEIEQITDQTGDDLMAGLIIRDQNGQIFPGQTNRVSPDLWFQPQVYRTSGDILKVPPGTYTITCLRGPEYIPQSKTVEVGNQGGNVSFNLNRWIDPSEFNYWSGDHHIHAAGCAHYIDPLEGVLPDAMARYIQGEDLKVGSVLTWGPGFDYQKQFFTGQVDNTSVYPYTIRYDVEVSGFGSHVSGHLVLLRLRDQIYPGGESKDHWPTLGLNTLKWAKKQGAITGPAHSGFGINTYSDELPNYEVPPYNSIGANEYVVDVTHLVDGPEGNQVPAVDFISTGDTWPVAELNMWYHTLNCGFRTRISGETDFPCITGARVGVWRSYVRQQQALDYDDWCLGIQKGANYVSDGMSHLIDFRVNQTLMGEGKSEISLSKPSTVKIQVKAAALIGREEQLTIKKLYIGDEGPFDPVPWGIENAVTGDSEVMLEIVMNGKPVEQVSVPANGELKDYTFEIPVDQSSWITARIFPSSHTNPVFVLVGNQPIRTSKKSAEWCRKGVEQCWIEKSKTYDQAEMTEAKLAYDHARMVYDRIIEESTLD
ncbi:MAG: hypothetical protein DHS20C17_35440 [Cyclobacteriaceae bacterium]|nr:MAG: hypothetical protein DHS20C17_35440 [Cyclobacteriaceae bacterium]